MANGAGALRSYSLGYEDKTPQTATCHHFITALTSHVSTRAAALFHPQSHSVTEESETTY